MPEVATREPARIVAGDTLEWVRELVEFPAPEWRLCYSLSPQSGGVALSIPSSPAGSRHRVSVPAADTAAWPAGPALLRAWVVSADGAQRYSVGVPSPVVELLEDPSIATVADGRSRAQRIVEALEEAYEKLASKTVTASTIAGNTYTLRNLDEMNRALREWRIKLEAEQREANPRLGRIYVRF